MALSDKVSIVGNERDECGCALMDEGIGMKHGRKSPTRKGLKKQ